MELAIVDEHQVALAQVAVEPVIVRRHREIRGRGERGVAELDEVSLPEGEFPFDVAGAD